MNEKYLLRLQEDLRLKNFTQSTRDDYYRFTKRFLEFPSSVEVLGKFRSFCSAPSYRPP